MIRVENLEKYYDRHKKNEKHVLQKINLELPSHGLIAVVGESGCGKTTLLRCISGLDCFDDGRMVYEGKHVSGWHWLRMSFPRRKNRSGSG